MSRIAIIGAGISGLSAAYYLSRQNEVHVFDCDTRIGGHTNTLIANSALGPVAVDTGFIVFNHRTYPRFTALLDELGVASQPSDMSFGVSAGGGAFEYSSRGVRGYFAQAANWARPEHYRLLAGILRFNREAKGQLAEAGGRTLGEFLDGGGYSRVFRERYLYPMAAAVWSMPAAEVAEFPAATLIRFFDHHGMLGIDTHPQWRTITGGSHQYLGPLTRGFAGNIHLGVRVAGVRRGPAGVQMHADAAEARFDEVVFACHGDQVLPMLADASAAEREVLARFRSSRNAASLHTDAGQLPRRERARASWNYRLNEGGPVTLTYHMNRLQRLQVAGRAAPEDFCVTLNAAPNAIAPERVVRDIVYEHPVYDRAMERSQAGWAEISGRQFRTHYCGAYWFNGFHEDGLRSAQRVAAAFEAAAGERGSDDAAAA